MIHEHPNIKFPCLRTFVYHAQNGDWCTTVGEIECFRPYGSREIPDKPADDARNHPPTLLIDDLPEDVKSDENKKFAQMDTVHSGSKGSGGVLTMVLPTDKHQAFIRKLTDFQQETIHKALRSIRRECKKQGIEIDHILTDNGSEFLDEKTIGGIFGAKVYYTHAYAGWETGTVENLNKLVRRFYPKGTDFSKVTRKQIKALQEKLTAYPRQLKPRKEPKMRIFSVWPVVCVILLAFFRADVKGIAYTRCFDLPLAPWQRVNQITPQSPHKAINAILLRRKCEKTLKRLYSTQESQRLMGRGDSGLRPMRTLPLRCTSL